MQGFAKSREYGAYQKKDCQKEYHFEGVFVEGDVGSKNNLYLIILISIERPDLTFRLGTADIDHDPSQT